MSEFRFWSHESLISYLRDLYDLVYIKNIESAQVHYWAVINELSRRGFKTDRVDSDIVVRV